MRQRCKLKLTNITYDVVTRNPCYISLNKNKNFLVTIFIFLFWLWNHIIDTILIPFVMYVKTTDLWSIVLFFLFVYFSWYRDTPMPPSRCVRSSDWAETRCFRSRAARSPTRFWQLLKSIYVFISNDSYSQ